MPIGISWCTIEEVVAKYSLEKALILKWIDEGIVRSEEAADGTVRVNLHDIELEVQERAGSFMK